MPSYVDVPLSGSPILRILAAPSILRQPGGEAAERILAGNILKTGFVGTHEAFGARSIMKSFEKCGATMTEPADDPPEIRTNGKAAARPAVGA